MATEEPRNLAIDAWAYRMVVVALGLAVLIALIAASVLGLYGKAVPEAVVAIDCAAAGALAGLLARSPVKTTLASELLERQHLSQRAEAEPDWGEAPTTLHDSAFESGSMNAFLQGVGSVLEFFPSPARFHAWRVTQDVPLNEGPVVVRDLLAELTEDA